jgi:dCMP deaminase
MNSSSHFGNRPDRDLYFAAMASLVSMRGTCTRRRVGCVLVNSQNHVIGTGYNGVASGQAHCFDVPCPGANAPSGEDLDQCYALHAEQNALLQCRDVREISTCYTTLAMCVTCTKLLLNTGTTRIVFLESYAQSNISEKLWKEAGGEWVQLNLKETNDVLKRAALPPEQRLDTAERVPEAYRRTDTRVRLRDQGSFTPEPWPGDSERRRTCRWHFLSDRGR